MFTARLRSYFPMLAAFCLVVMQSSGPVSAVGATSHISPLTFIQHPLAAAKKDFPWFHHRPLIQSGFNPLFLPFHHAFERPEDGVNRAQAFAFLLSGDLDFAPGNYCERHAYFTFSRGAVPMRKFINAYPEGLVAREYSGWNATVAVGGVLEHTAAGYSANIYLFNKAGQRFKTLRFPKPTTFWKLLGMVDTGFMTYEGEPPSQALKDFLCQPQCIHVRSLKYLGQAAFFSVQSKGAFSLFKKILGIDPNFSAVRYWYATQKQWTGVAGGEKYPAQISLSLQTRISRAEILSFVPQFFSIQTFNGSLNKAKELLGPNAPCVLDMRLEWAIDTGTTTAQLLGQCLACASKYPNYYPLVSNLATAYSQPKLQGLFNIALAGSLAATAMDDRWLTGREKKSEARRILEVAAGETGHPRLAATEYLGAPDLQGSSAGFWGLVQMGQFPRVVALWPMTRNYPRESRAILLPMYAYSLIMLHRTATLRQVLARYSPTLQQFHLMKLFQIFASAPGTPLPAISPMNTGQIPWPGSAIRSWLFLEVLLSNPAVRLPPLPYNNLIEVAPLDRLTWFYVDRIYQRLATSTVAMTDFYSSLGWLFPDDPWARRAVKAFAVRVGRKPPQGTDPESVLKMFLPLAAAAHGDQRNQQFLLAAVNHPEIGHMIVPTIVSAIHGFVEKGEKKKAAELARLWLWYARDCPSMPVAQAARRVMYLLKSQKSH